LLQWLRTFSRPPRVTYLVHGEPAAASALRDTMMKELRWNVQVAAYRQKVEVE
jgi:metallo-beta-lactamase family protein